MFKIDLRIFAWILLLSLYMVEIFIKIRDKKKRKHHHLLRLQVIFPNNKNPFQMSLNSITLTDTLTHTGVISAVDAQGNTYQGTLSNIRITISDASQDNVVVDPNAPNTVDVNNVTKKGGTTAALLADFVSNGNATPPAGSTATPIPDGTVFKDIPGTVTIINDLPETVQLQLAVNF